MRLWVLTADSNDAGYVVAGPVGLANGKQREMSLIGSRPIAMRPFCSQSTPPSYSHA
jgi:hypothetical protein